MGLFDLGFSCWDLNIGILRLAFIGLAVLQVTIFSLGIISVGLSAMGDFAIGVEVFVKGITVNYKKRSNWFIVWNEYEYSKSSSAHVWFERVTSLVKICVKSHVEMLKRSSGFFLNTKSFGESNLLLNKIYWNMPVSVDLSGNSQ